MVSEGLGQVVGDCKRKHRGKRVVDQYLLINKFETKTQYMDNTIQAKPRERRSGMMNYLENADTKSDHFLAQTEKPMLPETTASYCVCVCLCAY